MRKPLLLIMLPACLSAFGACASGPEGSEDPDFAEVTEREQPFTSDVATLLDSDFTGELDTSSATNLRQQIKGQLLYTVGQLNAEPGVARLERLTLSSITSSSLGNGLYRVRYKATLPIAWGHKTALPTRYDFVLPRRIDATGLSTFTDRYRATCNDGDPHDVSVANFWYHFRPRATGCTFGAADVVRLTATVKPSLQNTTAKYPEYHRVWEDNRLTILAVFGKYESGATSQSDAGIAAFNAFIRDVRREWPGAVATPTVNTETPAPSMTDIHFSLRNGSQTLEITALLVDELRYASTAWDKRYSELSPGADVIVYNGHAGLGANVRALSQKGRFFPGKYQLFFFNGCDTFAYVDDTLARTRALLNPEDPSGTRYMDTVSNAMPAYFIDMGPASMGLIRALMDPAAPDSFIRIFRAIDPVQVVVATGEEDNVFHPTFDPGVDWAGFQTSASVGYQQTLSYQTETLPAGKYVFTMTPDPARPGGDADLRIRAGAAPTLTTTYRCKSYLYNSNERCTITLTSPQKIYMTATGDKTGVQSAFTISAWQAPVR